jgi:glyoxylase-like metal-dependent hydrolase (beta-lactamase superfamily II)
VLPVPGPALMEMEDKSTLNLSSGRKLTFYHTPGHAKHHFSIMDSRTNTFFTGDTLGIRYPQLEERGVHLFLPSTSPNQFDPEAMLNSISLAESLQPDRIAFGHFFISEEPAKVYKDINKWLPVFMEKGEYVLKNDQDWNALKELLLAEIKKELEEFNIPEDDPVYEVIQLDLTVSAMGIVDYLTKQTV